MPANGVMSVGAHAVQHHGIWAVQVNQDVARVSIVGVGLNVDITSLTVANPQKSDGSSTDQLTGSPKPFSGERAMCWLMNQADQIQLVGHGCELAANGLPGEKNSAVVHDRNLAIGTTRRTMNSQRTANSVLTRCLSPGAHLRPPPGSQRFCP